MGSISGDSAAGSERDDPNAHEEKIFVSVRLRPLNDKESAKNEVSDWECINNTTIIFKNSLQERTMLPTAYTFDRVFGCDCPTRQVYEEAAKKVALSVLSGINSSIFAYGQTSSGKTYTMSGVTESAIVDIYDYIDKHCEREFVLKFSAIEIYNESVRDLLSTDSTPLRLLDDPEKGTIVDKLSEVTLRDLDHLRELLSICDAQRQIGETNLNEMSSRSHQILRLTVESSAREYVRAANSSALTASVNFIDLAGSECASQTLSAGTRLKEGCHINRSLLTLGTVIRKLSKGRNGHVPYRDSKLTRILQNCLGGNARTAIICTMSPAHSHVEKSRNTLLFASCAKQVNTNARVNVVMSEKALVKQLQKELARLENELRKITSLTALSDSSMALKEKEMLIEKMDREIRELTAQRDLARARTEDLLHFGGESQTQTPRSWGDNYEKGSWGDDFSISEASEIVDTSRSDVASRTSHFSDRCEGLHNKKLEEPFLENSDMQFLSDDTSPREYIEKYFGPDPCKGWEKTSQENNKNLVDNYKEVQCIETDTIASTMPSTPMGKQESTHVGEHESGQSPCSSDDEDHMGRADVQRSKSCTELPLIVQNSPSAELTECRKCKSFNEFLEQPLEREDDDQDKVSKVESMGNDEDLCIKDLESSITTNSMNENEETIKVLIEDCTTKQQDEMIKPKSQTQFEDNTDLELEKASKGPEKTTDNCSKNGEDVEKSTFDWSKEFERQRREIIELWDACNTPLVHRTYFLLLFKGDPSDAVYMEVELRRLSFLKNSSCTDLASAKSSRALHKEREMLSKQMFKKYSTKEREALFEKWGINLKSKHRRNQLCRRLWTDAKNMDHIHESAAIVAKLVGFQNENHAPKEMFGLSFSTNLKSNSWRNSLPLMM